MSVPKASSSPGDGDGGRPPSSSRRRSSTLLEEMNDRLHSHFMSTMALCSAVFTMFFLLMSVFPYSGFMVMHLLDGVDSESAGKYAGFLTSSIMIGRAFSSYAWGKIADVYGRKFVLVIALVSSAVGSILFGCSTSYAMALFVRFIMGLCNGTMIVARTAISELSRGDKELESKGVGILMSMVGYGMLISPSVGGLLSEPLTQHPDSVFFQRFEGVLEPYPFLLPNLIAAVMATLSLVFVIVSVEETLPEEKRRHWIHVVDDTAAWFFNKLCSCCKMKVNHDRRPTTIGIDTDNRPSNTEVSTIVGSTASSEYLPTDEWDDEWDEEMKILDSAEFMVSATLLSTPNNRASFCNALHRSSMESHLSQDEQDETKLEYMHPTHQHQQQQQNNKLKKLATLPSDRPLNETTPLVKKDESDRNNKNPKQKPSAPNNNSKTTTPANNHIHKRGSIHSIMNVKSTRWYLLTYWVYAFASVSQQEAFPLFAMSHLGGLGLEETQIGLVGTFSGLLYCFGQYFVFTSAMKHLGLLQSLRYGALWANIPVILIPFSLWMSGWWQIAYLSVVSGITMISGSVFLGCSTIGANRTVAADRRATMNGLSSLGTSIGRGTGPIFAGFLVASSMTSGIIPAEFGGWVVYSVLFVLGLVSFWMTLLIPPEE